MSQDAPSASEVKAKLQAVNRARGQMMENRVNMQLAAKKILTPEQRKKMKELRKQGPAGRGGKWREGRGGRGPRPCPRQMDLAQPGS
jgi:Spy/CpxP family protein refolding chaperone